MKQLQLPKKKRPAPDAEPIEEAAAGADASPLAKSSLPLNKALPFLGLGLAAVLVGGYLTLRTPQATEATTEAETQFEPPASGTPELNSSAPDAGADLSPEEDIAVAAATPEEKQKEEKEKTASGAATSGIAKNPNPGTRRIHNPFVTPEDTGKANAAPTVSSAAPKEAAAAAAPSTSSGWSSEQAWSTEETGTGDISFTDTPSVMSAAPAPAEPLSSTPKVSSSKNSAAQSKSVPAAPSISWTAAVPEERVAVPLTPSRTSRPAARTPSSSSAVILPPTENIGDAPVITFTPAEPAASAGSRGAANRETVTAESTLPAAEVVPQAPKNQAAALIAEHGLSYEGLAQSESGTQTVMLDSRYGPVYVKAGETIPGTEGKVAQASKEKVSITVGKDSASLQLNE